MMNKLSLKQSWISDAAYFKSLDRSVKQNSEKNDWLEAEQEYLNAMQKRVKSGLVRIAGQDS